MQSPDSRAQCHHILVCIKNTENQILGFFISGSLGRVGIVQGICTEITHHTREDLTEIPLALGLRPRAREISVKSPSVPGDFLYKSPVQSPPDLGIYSTEYRAEKLKKTLISNLRGRFLTSGRFQ